MWKLKCLLVILLLYLFCSCEFEENQMGLPKKVKIPKTGETQIYYCSQPLTNITVFNEDNRMGSSIVNEEILVQSEWLTVKSPCGSKRMVIIAEPNNGTGTRNMEIQAYSGREYATIKIIQY